MKSIVIQFHAELDEILDFIRTVSSELDLVVVLMALSPFRVMQIDSDVDLKIEEINRFRGKSRLRVHLLVRKANCLVDTPNKFLDANPGCIVINVGFLNGSHLEESSLMFRSSDKSSTEAAKKIASKLKKITKAGVVAVNPDTGTESIDRTHRYTKGAKSLYGEGIKFAPIAGKSILKIPK